MASLLSSVAREVVTLGGEVALVEDEVDDGQDRTQPVGQLGVGRDSVGDVGGLDLALGPHEPLGHRRLRDEEGTGDLGCLQPGDEPQGERHLGARRQGRVAAGEDQAQLVVDQGPDLLGLVGHLVAGGLGLALVAGALAADLVDAPVAGGRDDPAGGAGRQPALRPSFEGDDEGVLDRLLGEIDVAEEADQAGHRSPGFGTEDALDVDRAQDSGSSWKGRTSTGPAQAALPSAAHLRAASRSAASMTQKPPICSLASGKGPSVMVASPLGCVDHGGGVGCLQTTAEHPGALLLELGVELVDCGVGLLRCLLVGVALTLDHVDGEQVLRHVNAPWCGGPASCLAHLLHERLPAGSTPAAENQLAVLGEHLAHRALLLAGFEGVERGPGVVHPVMGHEVVVP